MPPTTMILNLLMLYIPRAPWTLVSFKTEYTFVWTIDIHKTIKLSNSSAFFHFLLIRSVSFHVGYDCMPDRLDPAVSSKSGNSKSTEDSIAFSSTKSYTT